MNRCRKFYGSLIVVLLVSATATWSAEVPKTRAFQMAAFALPTGVPADWQQWDSFLTFAMKQLGQQLQPAQRDRIGEVFLDTRYQLTQLVSNGASDPVPSLFLDSWDRLSRVLKQAWPTLAPQTATQFSSFISSMDGIKSLASVGNQFGLFRITPDVLRSAANFLGTGSVDPLAYTVEIDTALRNLLGFTNGLPASRPSPLLEQGRLERLRKKASAALRLLSARSANAAEVDFDRLNQWVPEIPEVQDYLIEVRQLLNNIANSLLAKSSLAKAQQQLFRQIVYTTGWQESCWRQFIKKDEKLTTLASSTGDLGIMQVNRMTWRSVYDVKGLSGDINYNWHAGAEILHYYLKRFAIPKNENKQPGGHLARATYSTYNAGPGGVARYHGVRKSLVWKKVDDAFWSKFQALSSGQDLPMKGCSDCRFTVTIFQIHIRLVYPPV